MARTAGSDVRSTSMIAWTWGNFMVLSLISQGNFSMYPSAISLVPSNKHCIITPKEGPGWLVTVNLPQKAEHNTKNIYSMGSGNL